MSGRGGTLNFGYNSLPNKTGGTSSPYKRPVAFPHQRRTADREGES
jgi:hypothetical protein